MSWKNVLKGGVTFEMHTVAESQWSYDRNTNIVPGHHTPWNSAAKPHAKGGEGLANITLDHTSLECQLHDWTCELVKCQLE